MDTVKLFSMLLICAALMFVCDAQLTFTPAWGKRSPGALGMSPLAGTSYGQDACKTPVDSLLVIYRMIQAEAQKIVDCSQK
ncbi:hypertrehalosaemic prohormone [Anopheles ziemanni]|uniref:AGAP008834-PB-like protein n=1 Tax=Anopheles sinensis TaxID=74873 RepID=A0A084VYF4_ANOSI|nr:hypertrehalosaemic prohormone [Anopheles coustani]XP_058166702.1 hypertrehalosaemic prohormone [Anopheles ziemanni]KFB42998.1 AGAP008834-PB-like protein [Anopheles sinensis]